MDKISTKGQMIDQIDLSAVPHSGFDRSNHNYFTGRLGAIIPTRLDEVYPGDRIKGTPTMVTNFEPLAAPLMGSMVQKQECFFVPYIQLWRHAYKFFSQKEGFQDSVPSVSPKRIFRVFNNFLQFKIIDAPEYSKLTELFNNLIVSRSNQLPYLESSYSGQSFAYDLVYLVDWYDNQLKSIYSNRKMLDLYFPLIKYLKEYVNSDEIITISKSYDTTYSDALCYSACDILADIVHIVFNFFFGPSSIFDYLGWQIPYFPYKKEYGDRDYFQYVFYRNLNIPDSINFESDLISKFSEVPLNFMPFKAYYLIWYWNYRDQLLETGILDPQEDEFTASDVTDNVILYCCMLRQRCWFKDAYTTALTNTGDGNLLVPIDSPDSEQQNRIRFFDDGGAMLENISSAQQAINAGATICEVTNGGISYKIPMNYLRGAYDNDYGTKINRQYFSLDMFDRIKRLRSVLQKRLILGYEVDDVVYSSFLVRMSNVRLHIPEILATGRSAVEISTLVNNTSTSEQIAGDKTATAWAKGTTDDLNYFSEEWGFYMSFATIMPIQSYAGGMQRLYFKKDVYDYMWPEFATMGMDAVYNVELASLGRLTDSESLAVFGYQGRYYDLKYRQDEEHGRLLTDLNYLTFSREFDSENPPKLNYIFVHCWPRLDGFVISSPLDDVFRSDCYTAQGWERRLPVPSNYVH